jgi:hypothetical protein
MAANVQPIYPKQPNTSFNTISAANTAKDGTGTVVLGWTVGLNGSRLDAIKCVPLGTNVASVLRIFQNNGGANSTPTNNGLFQEISLPATTVTEVAAQTPIILKFDGIEREPAFFNPASPGYKLNMTLGTAVAAGWEISFIGGDY